MSIDVTGVRKMDWVVLDSDGTLSHGVGDADDVVETVAAEAPDVVAVDAPLHPNLQLLDETARKRLNIEDDARYRDCRLAEAELQRRAIPCYSTGQSRADSREWMRSGWLLCAALRAHGYKDLAVAGTIGRFDQSSKLLIEVYPFASFVVRLGWVPAKKTALAGNIERIACVLHWGESFGMSRGKGWPPTEFLTDLQKAVASITMGNVLERGARAILQFSHDHLDALVGALTAHCAANGQAFGVGDPREGIIVLPRQPLESYRPPR